MSELQAPPYPADTRAKGWRFELDYERIEQSDTWSLAGEIPMAQHALLMLWLVAWTQVPCGSLPGDDSIIRAKCRIPQSTWSKCRGLLMRGWIPASDGRLYHATITARVAEMLEYRRKESERRTKNRGKSAGTPQDDTGTPPGTPPGVPRDTTGVPDTGTGTGTVLIQPPPSSEVPASPLRADPATPPPAFDGKNTEILNGKAVVALAQGWELPETWGIDAEALGWQPNEVLREGEKFRQYWTAGKGKGTRRSVKGWRQSWSTWLSKAAEHRR